MPRRSVGYRRGFKTAAQTRRGMMMGDQNNGRGEAVPTFPLNAWYAAAWSQEVGRRQPLARTVCNKSMVFWRKSDGSIAALEDACWHRLLPLSMGQLDGDDIVCHYHGLTFDGTGRCVRIPSQDKLIKSACVLSCCRPVPVRLGLARRSRFSRSRAHPGYALERRS